MQGTTHLAVGCTAALLILQPKTMPELILGLGVASVGSIICDVDSDASIPRRKADKLFAYTAFVAILLSALDYFFDLGLLQFFISFTGLARILVGFLVAVAICHYGKNQEHRTFMHSLVAMFGLTGCLYWMIPGTTRYFAIAFASHLLLDLLNYRGVQLLFPLHCKFSFGLCKSNGRVNKLLLLIFSPVLLITIAALVIRIISV